jgi:hypothetical protein
MALLIGLTQQASFQRSDKSTTRQLGLLSVVVERDGDFASIEDARQWTFGVSPYCFRYKVVEPCIGVAWRPTFNPSDAVLWACAPKVRVRAAAIAYRIVAYRFARGISLLDDFGRRLQEFEDRAPDPWELISQPSEHRNRNERNDLKVEVRAQFVRLCVGDSAEDGIAMYLCKHPDHAAP